MIKNILFCLSVLMIFLFSGCSSLSLDDCQKMNWFEKGELIAERGEDFSELTQVKSRCEGFGVKVDEETYMQGYRNGLKTYCTYKNGFDRGMEGKDSLRPCEEMNPDYTRGYQKAYAEYKILKHKEELARAEEKRQKEEKEKLEEEILKRYNTKKCTTKMDCSGKEKCIAITEYTESNQPLIINICR